MFSTYPSKELKEGVVDQYKNSFAKLKTVARQEKKSPTQEVKIGFLEDTKAAMRYTLAMKVVLGEMKLNADFKTSGIIKGMVDVVVNRDERLNQVSTDNLLNLLPNPEGNDLQLAKDWVQANTTGENGNPTLPEKVVAKLQPGEKLLLHILDNPAFPWMVNRLVEERRWPVELAEMNEHLDLILPLLALEEEFSQSAEKCLQKECSESSEMCFKSQKKCLEREKCLKAKNVSSQLKTILLIARDVVQTVVYNFGGEVPETISLTDILKLGDTKNTQKTSTLFDLLATTVLKKCPETKEFATILNGMNIEEYHKFDLRSIIEQSKKMKVALNNLPKEIANAQINYKDSPSLTSFVQEHQNTMKKFEGDMQELKNKLKQAKKNLKVIVEVLGKQAIFYKPKQPKLTVGETLANINELVKPEDMTDDNLDTWLFAYTLHQLGNMWEEHLKKIERVEQERLKQENLKSKKEQFRLKKEQHLSKKAKKEYSQPQVLTEVPKTRMDPEKKHEAPKTGMDLEKKQKLEELRKKREERKRLHSKEL